jgi:hypothetical protein
MSKPKFESTFGNFVTDFGGELVPENSKDKLADYLFRKQNVVAELKCLTEDQTTAMNNKVTEMVRNWIRKNKKTPTEDFLRIATAPPEIQTPWLNFLSAQVENFVRKANRQIRSTKVVHNLPTAKGLLLVFNEGNPLHNRPEDFRKLLAIVLRKRRTGNERAFPHINGAVYFSFDTVKTQQKMNFWAPLQMQEPDEDVTPLKQFQHDLQQAFYLYLQRTRGRPVRRFKID